MALRKKKHNTKFNRKLPIEHTRFYPYMQKYLEWSAITGCSQDTIKRRDSALRRFINWCDERDIKHPSQVTKPIIDRYQRHLYYYRKKDGSPLGFSSQNVMLTPIKGFFKWLTKQNYIAYNPASEIELPKKERRLPRTILTTEEIESIMSQPDIETPEGIRNRAILETFYATGIRRKELTNLAIYDVDYKRQIVFIREGKGKQDRVIPIGERALNWIAKYQNDIRYQMESPLSGDALFLSDYGEPLNINHASKVVKDSMNKADVNYKGSCHLFRHAFATHMLENGADTRFIQAMLGHRDLNSTQIYTRVSVEKLRQIYQATHPANMGREPKPEPKQTELIKLEESARLEPQTRH